MLPATVWRRPLAGLLLAATISAGGCAQTQPGKAQPPAPSPPHGAARLAATVLALCEATARAAHSVPLARGIFFDRAHDDLHKLARLAQIRDRAAAARLSQAKDTVERDFWYQQTWPRLAQDLPVLTEAIRRALAALGLSPPTCDPRPLPPL